MLEKTAEQQAYRAEILALAKEQLNPGAPVREAEARFERAAWMACGKAGLTGLMAPKQYSGRGLDALSTVYALEALGYGSRDTGLNFALAAHVLACVAPIVEYGSAAQQEKYLPLLCSGEWVAANAITETSAGSDVYQMNSSGKPDAKHYTLSGHKTYCSNGVVADLFVCYVNTNSEKDFFGGVSGFIIEKTDQGVTVSEQIDKLGIRSCPLGEMTLNDVQLAADRRLGEEGAGGQIFNQSMNWERICLGGIHIGAMDWLLEEATRFANKRQSGGSNLSSYQALSHPLANFKVQLEGARLLTYQAALALDAGSRKTAKLASQAKLAVSECYKGLCLHLMQLYAGAAYRSPHPAEQHMRAALASTVYSGTSEIHRNLVARYMGLRPNKLS